MRGCNVDRCDRTHYAHGLCQRHYLRWYRRQPPWPHVAPLTRRTRRTFHRGGRAV